MSMSAGQGKTLASGARKRTAGRRAEITHPYSRKRFCRSRTIRLLRPHLKNSCRSLIPSCLKVEGMSARDPQDAETEKDKTRRRKYSAVLFDKKRGGLKSPPKKGLWDKDMSLQSSSKTFDTLCHWISCIFILASEGQNVHRSFCRKDTTFVEKQ